MKNALPFLFFILSFTTNAQSLWQKMSIHFRAGAIFANYENNYVRSYYNPYRLDTHNHWNLELSIEDKKYGLGLTTRYITSIRGFIKNPIYGKAVSVQNIQIGELSSIGQDLSGFTFFINKRLLFLGNKHRIDFGLGTQKREGASYYFRGAWCWECFPDSKPLDKQGVFSRLGYTYLINKHFSVSTNFEYTRFEKRPTDLFFVDILAGVRF